MPLDVRVDGSGSEIEVITLRHNSAISCEDASPLEMSLQAMHAKGDFAITTRSKERHRKFRSGTFSSVPVAERASISIKGRQHRTLQTYCPEDYYLMPVGVIQRLFQENFSVFRNDAEKVNFSVASALGKRDSIWTYDRRGVRLYELKLHDLAGPLTYEKLEKDKLELAMHILPYWSSPDSFVLLQKPFGLPFNFNTFRQASSLYLEGGIAIEAEGGIMIDGAMYESASISGRGSVHAKGTIKRLSLASPVSVKSDFARVTGYLDFIRSDGISKDWHTSVQLSPAELALSASHRYRTNPEYVKWLSWLGASSASLIVAVGSAAAGIYLSFGKNADSTVLALIVFGMPLPSLLGLAGLLEFVPKLNATDAKLVPFSSINADYSGKLFAGNIIRSPSLR